MKAVEALALTEFKESIVTNDGSQENNGSFFLSE